MRGEGIVPTIDLATGNGGNNGGFGGGFGEGGWAWIIVLFLIFGYWRNGFGNNGNGSNGGGSVMDAYILNSDFATLQRLIDSSFDRTNSGINQVNQGICNLGYSTLENFNTTNMGVATGFANLNNALCNQSFQIERGITGLGSQLAECCCDLRSGIQGVNYNMAINTNALQNTLCNNTRDIIDNQNANYRALHDEIVANRIEDKNAQIQALQQKNYALELSASQANQTNYITDTIIDRLSPCPKPSYLVCNPNAPLNYSVYANNGCGCGSYNY